MQELGAVDVGFFCEKRGFVKRWGSRGGLSVEERDGKKKILGLERFFFFFFWELII